MRVAYAQITNTDIHGPDRKLIEGWSLGLGDPIHVIFFGKPSLLEIEEGDVIGVDGEKRKVNQCYCVPPKQHVYVD